MDTEWVEILPQEWQNLNLDQYNDGQWHDHASDNLNALPWIIWD